MKLEIKSWRLRVDKPCRQAVRQAVQTSRAEKPRVAAACAGCSACGMADVDGAPVEAGRWPCWFSRILHPEKWRNSRILITRTDSSRRVVTDTLYHLNGFKSTVSIFLSSTILKVRTEKQGHGYFSYARMPDFLLSFLKTKRRVTIGCLIQPRTNPSKLFPRGRRMCTPVYRSQNRG